MFGQDMTRIEELIAKATGQIASKATISTSTNIAAYDLEPLLKQVYPVLAPFRNKYLPRTVSPIGGTAHNAKRLTAINPASGGMGIAEGLRGASIAVTEQDFSAIFRTVGQEADITFEAEDLARGFDDAMAIRTVSLFNSNLMEEERLVLFGNGGNITVAGGSAQTALGTPTAPTLTNNGGATGTVAAATYYAWVVALTYNGLRFSSVANGVQTQITRPNNDGSTTTTNGGSSNVSAQSNSVVLAAPGSLAMSCTAVAGAFGYAWFVGTAKASAYLAGVTPVNTFTLTAPPVGTQAATAITADNSIDSYVFDGLLTQIQQSGSGAYFKSLDGANLTSSSAAGIMEIDAALLSLYDNYKLGPQVLMVDAGTAQSINRKVIAAGGAPLFRFNVSGDKGGILDVTANSMVGTYLNPFTGELIKLETHPWFPQGTILGLTLELPYTTPNVPKPYKLIPRVADWREFEWPLVSRKRVHGQYLTAALIAYTPWAFFLLQNVGQN
jgi:hypothetical protein